MTEHKKSGLSRALVVNAKPASSGRDLVSALRQKSDALVEIGGPKTANLEAVKNAFALSTVTVQQAVAAQEKQGGICFVIDATSSREKSWADAQKTQAEMFGAVGKVEIGVVCHRGARVQNLGWFKETLAAGNEMAKVSCLRGETRIVAAIEEALDCRNGKVPSMIILVGDEVESTYDTEQKFNAVISRLNKTGVKVFSFVEGDCAQGALCYEKIARATGGIFKKFGEQLDLNLTDLCVAATVLDTGGAAAFERLLQSGHKGALALAHDVKRLQIGHSGGKPSAPKA